MDVSYLQTLTEYCVDTFVPRIICPPPVWKPGRRDAALIIAAQKVEHYEIATYGGLVQLAVTLRKNSAAQLLDKTLNEEEQTDRRLTEIAENDINMEAEEEMETDTEVQTPAVGAWSF